MSKSYQQLQTELQAVLEKLEDPELDIEQSFTEYEKGEKLIAELEKYLKTAQNKISKLSDWLILVKVI